jgi:hypothetical protein
LEVVKNNVPKTHSWYEVLPLWTRHYGENSARTPALTGQISSTGVPSCPFIYILKWVCLKMGYTPNYSHLVGIMIINHWV